MIDWAKVRRIHLIGVAGTGMGSFGGMLKAAGYEVTGSDENVYPPMSTQLERWGIDVLTPYAPANLDRVSAAHDLEMKISELRASVEHLKLRAREEFDLGPGFRDIGAYEFVGPNVIPEEGTNGTVIGIADDLKGLGYLFGGAYAPIVGQKLNGEFVIVQMKGRGKGNEWLLIKKKDDFAQI